MVNKVSIVLLIIIILSPIYAYIGPGTSTGLIALSLGSLVQYSWQYSAYFYYPIKRFLKNRKKK